LRWFLFFCVPVVSFFLDGFFFRIIACKIAQFSAF